MAQEDSPIHDKSLLSPFKPPACLYEASFSRISLYLVTGNT